MSKIQDTLAPIRQGQAVVLSESYFAFLKVTAGPALLVLGSGLVLGLMKGGLWWGIAAAGAIILAGIVLWGIVRKRPRITIDAKGLSFDGRSFAWTEIESFGAGGAEYVPDWVSLVDNDGESHELESTFGWKNTQLRDGLNELLRELNPSSARAQYETTVDAASRPDSEISNIRFRRPSGPDDAIEQARQLLGRYYHADCDTITEVSDRVIQIAALDPHYFPLGQTDCSGCGSASMKEVMLENGQTLYDVFREMQKAVPLKAALGKFFLFAAVLAPAGMLLGLSIPVPRNRWLLGFLGGGLGFLVGIGLSILLYRRLRRAGWMW